MKIRIQFKICALAIAASVSCAPLSSETRLNESGIVVTAPESQRGSAFCWSYAITALIEQRFFERTRGIERGGFRINLSEEYLGLVHLLHQLTTSKRDDDFIGEGLRLGRSLDLLKIYGIVPEKISGKPLFRAKFEELIGARIRDAALDLKNRTKSKWPLSLDEALAVVSAEAKLTPEQTTFLRGAVSGKAELTEFQYGKKKYDPKTYMRDYLKFNPEDFVAVAMPSPLIRRKPNPEYQRIEASIKKAMLYGYAVPASFNYLGQSEQIDGKLSCIGSDCSQSQLADFESPHANHAVLLFDYKSASSSFGQNNAQDILKSFNEPVTWWAFKNSWGFNRNTSRNPELLARFPIPAFSEMEHSFFQTSHRLKPKRFDVILPKNVCYRKTDPKRTFSCDPLVAEPTNNTNIQTFIFDTALNPESLRLVAERSKITRSPLSYIQFAGNTQLKWTISKAESAPITENLPKVFVTSDTTTQNLIEDRFYACLRVEPISGVSLAAVYFLQTGNEKNEALPQFILNEQNAWQHCELIPNDPASFTVIIQGIDKSWRPVLESQQKLIVSGS